MRLVMAAAAVLLMTASAEAQTSGAGGHGRHQAPQSGKADTQKPKANDKAYNAALHSLPDKPYDPWHGAR